MQALDNYRRRLKTQRGVDIPAQIRKRNDVVMEGAWFRDPETFRARIYKHKEGTRGFEYEDIASDYVRLIRRTVQDNVSTDVDMYVQFRPGIFYPVGSYIDIVNTYPDEEGNETWTTYLITNREDSQQFTMFNVLPCNYMFRFVNKNRLYQSLGVVRNMNSYSSGMQPKASTILILNDMKQCWIPADSCSFNLHYGKRLVISDERRAIPLVWSISKIEDLNPPGVSKYTLQQADVNLDTDWDEKWGYVADIHSDILIEDDPTVITSYDGDIVLEIGTKQGGTITFKKSDAPQIKFGSYVKMSGKFIDSNGDPITGLNYDWVVEGLNGEDYTDMIMGSSDLTFRVKREYRLGGKRFFVTCKSDDGNYTIRKEFEIIVM